MPLDEFLNQAASHGPCIAIHPDALPLEPPTGFELRVVDGTHLTTADDLYDAFARAWHFPEWFGRNEPALDDLMRDLDGMINDALGKPPATGYLTEITNAHLIFVDETPLAFSWFAGRAPFYRDYYRDEAEPRAVFGLLLSAPADQLDTVRQRWRDVGADITEVTA